MTLGELFGHDAKLPDSLQRMPISGLAADSREVKPGYLFAALPGVKPTAPASSPMRCSAAPP